MEERLEEESAEVDFGPEHRALVADADQLLSVGKAEEARDVVLRLRMRYPDSLHTRRVSERLRIAGGANEYWREHDRGNDFHALFVQGVGGAIGAVGGYACAAFGAIFLIYVLRAIDSDGRTATSKRPALAVAASLVCCILSW